MTGGDLGDRNGSGSLVFSLLEVERGGAADVDWVGGGMGVGGVDTGKAIGRER